MACSPNGMTSNAAKKATTSIPTCTASAMAYPACCAPQNCRKRPRKPASTGPTPAGVLAKIREELDELQAAVDSQDLEGVSEEMGDLLFSVVNLARFRKIDPEVLMAAANSKFEERFGEMERVLKSSGLTLEAATASPDGRRVGEPRKVGDFAVWWITLGTRDALPSSVATPKAVRLRCSKVNGFS